MYKEPKPLSELDVKSIKAVTFDIDGVVIPTGTELKTSLDGTEYYMKSHVPSEQFFKNIRKIQKKIHVSFSSGRNMLYLQSVFAPIWGENVSYLAENGNLMLYRGRLMSEDYSTSFASTIANIREQVILHSEINLRGFEPKNLILTIHCDEHELIPAIVKSLDKNDQFYCLWTGEAYDIGHNRWNKGLGMLKLCRYLDISPKQMLTSGNQLNDVEMLMYGTGVTVNPDVVWGEYKTSGGGLGGEELAEYLAKNL